MQMCYYVGFRFSLYNDDVYQRVKLLYFFFFFWLISFISI